MVFDDKFSTINNQERDGIVDPQLFNADQWEQLIESGYELYLDPDEPERPELDDSWLTPNERIVRQERWMNRLHNRSVSSTPLPTAPPPATILPGSVEPLQDETVRPATVRWHDVEANEPTIGPPREPIEDFLPDNSGPPSVDPVVRTRSGRQVRRPRSTQASRFGEWINYTESHYAKKIKTGIHDFAFMQGLKWTEFVDQLRNGATGSLGSVLSSLTQDYDEGTVEDWNPMIFAIKADAASAADNPTWAMAMNGPDRNG